MSRARSVSQLVGANTALGNTVITGTANISSDVYVGGRVGVGTSSPTASAERFIQLAGAATSEVRLQTTTTGTTTSDGFGIQMWSDNNVYLWNYEANSSTIFGNNGLARVWIDSAGRVTMPAQPAFRATKTNGAGSSGTGVIVFNQINTNIGSCYNNSNGLFTAPVSGMYQLNFTGITNNDSNTNLSIQVNGSAVCWTYAFFSQTYSNLSMGVSTYMSAGDSARVNVLSGNVYDATDGGSARFSGFLIG